MELRVRYRDFNVSTQVDVDYNGVTEITFSVSLSQLPVDISYIPAEPLPSEVDGTGPTFDLALRDLIGKLEEILP